MKRKKVENSEINIDQIMEDYAPHNDDIWNEDSALIDLIKNIIYNDLNEAQQRVILLYAEVGKQREVAKILGCSPSSINLYLQRLRKKIAKKLISYGYLDKTDTDKCNRLLCD